MTDVARLRLVDDAGELAGERGCDRCEDVEVGDVENLQKQNLKLLRANGRLETALEEWTDTHHLRPEIDCLVACWEAATKRTRSIDHKDNQRMARALYRPGGFRLALIAIRGGAYDPWITTRKNGTKKKHNDLRKIFEDAATTQDFAERAPQGWEPNAEKVAALAGQSVEWVEERLSAKWKAPKQAEARRAA